MNKFIAKLLTAAIPQRKLRKRIRNYLMCRLNAKRRIADHFQKKLGYPLNLKNPRTFNEKSNWLKFNYKNPLMTTCADKYLVRQYLKNKGLEAILVPLLSHATTFNDLDWKSLPDRFVLKTNHDSGGVRIVKDKENQDKGILCTEITKALSSPFGLMSHELHYLSIKPMIIAEKCLTKADESLIDYKIFCFNGVPHFIQVDFDRFTDHTRTFYNLSWDNLGFSTKFPVAKKSIKRPKKLKEMLSIAETLSADFPLVRVDLYYIDDKIYFGELTFFPDAGLEKFSHFKWELTLGDLLKLPAQKHPRKNKQK